MVLQHMGSLLGEETSVPPKAMNFKKICNAEESLDMQGSKKRLRPSQGGQESSAKQGMKKSR
jgi:hypothetical protein